ncbi:unnamed protein product [Rotaria sordida]|uniref:SHSP domain-containing protein n=1 Tax=Rotaria sordida TaxID=392033 RepID=A0A814BUD4_9BILA|nr:unnamed protein product [Rotaria sordida]CAF0934790.1 unnamed protein product [Rotaria sordida]CAF0991525.1 unnamed protein product [Rotaria sordida]CAF3617004.1 unnamed protein product [Rotaria sordida]CAF3808825.1 unnamed protein product [Rotaria sordida]
MASTRIISRVLVPTTLCRLSTIGNIGTPIRHFFYRNPGNLPDVFRGTASSVFRDLEREFDRMQRQFDNYFRGNTADDSRSLTNYSRGENDMIVTESDGSRKFQLAFNMHGFEPEEVKIKTQKGSLIVSAKKEKKDGNSYSLHEFNQTYTLPEELKLEDLKSTFAENGILTIEAPLPKVEPKDRQIQIEHSK